MAEHAYKVWPAYFDAIREGRKTFDVRKLDRPGNPPRVGDTLHLIEWDPVAAAFTGRELIAEVTYIVSGAWGIPLDVAVFALKLLRWPTPAPTSPETL